MTVIPDPGGLANKITLSPLDGPSASGAHGLEVAKPAGLTTFLPGTISLPPSICYKHICVECEVSKVVPLTGTRTTIEGATLTVVCDSS